MPSNDNDMNMPAFAPAPVALLVNSKVIAEKVVEEAMALSKDDDFAVLISRSLDVEKRLLPAYINAIVRSHDGSMRSNSLSLEILLFVSGTMNIGSAIERSGARGREFIIFASSRKIADTLISKFKMSVMKEYKLELDTLESGKVAVTRIKDEK